MTTISLRMDDEMKKELDEMCEAMGMNISTFYMVYTKKALRERKIPFEIEPKLRLPNKLSDYWIEDRRTRTAA